MFSNLKTSTQISLKFTIFTILQVLFFGFFANILFFFNWYNGERHKLFNGNPRPIFQQSKNMDDNPKGRPPLTNMEKFDLNSNESALILSSIIIGNISNVDDGYFMYKVDKAYLTVIDITPHINMQINLLLVTLLLVFLFSLGSYTFSLFFVKSSLKKLNLLNSFLEEINIDKLDKKIEITGDPEDEINKVSQKFNEALEKVYNQTLSLKDFIRNASHEIKTPLMSISTEIDYAKKSKNYESGLDNIKDQLKSIKSLLDTLLEITKFESNININKEKINISLETKKILDNISLLYLHKNIHLKQNIDSDVYLDVNKYGWCVIVKNLLENAFKFTSDNGTVELELLSDKFTIKDNGIGIDQQNINKIWERFWQGDSSNTDTKSFGLGLYLTKILADKHGFTIDVESEPNVGTTFTIYFNNNA